MRKSVIVDGNEVGYILYNIYINQTKTLYVNHFTMHPQFRRKGHFKIMIEETKNIARSLGCPTITLSVGSHDETEEFLTNLYKRYGFKEFKKNWMQANV